MGLVINSMGIAVLWAVQSISATASPIVITFDGSNDLANNFDQSGTISSSPPYVQSLTGGIVGGSVTGYSGSQYQATAVYKQVGFNISKSGATVLSDLRGTPLLRSNSL
jgi:hypothetical protein